MEKFLCIHGQFNQPPRENPWLETVEVQNSAAPYHDWNERITAECYAPNAAARILQDGGRIAAIVNNYARISFSFGPPFLMWMKEKAPEVHAAIVGADHSSRERFSGHGSALAQAYNHMVLPLANARDKYTQVLWGIRDFEFRFGRLPEGLWLPDTAVDTATLETLAELGIKFTILSPFQASRTRELGKRNWREVSGGQIDPSRPYLARLPSGRSLTLFFYDAGAASAVAFGHVMDNGERFVQRLMAAFNDRRSWDQLVHIATDGESYGHHHKYGEMALAYALDNIEQHHLARLTNYAEYLAGHAPDREVQILENSSWSCPHGVERWRADCGCKTGHFPGWNQQWRAPLRQALDWLRDELIPLFEQKGREFLRDPWAARNDYIHVILNRAPENREPFFAAQAARPLSEKDKVTVLKLMELQRHAMLMYTSSGWFFDEISGLESVQVLQYAGRTLQLARELFDRDLEPGFLDLLARAKSNLPEQGDGRKIFQTLVLPGRIDLPKITAHYAINCLFQRLPKKLRIYSCSFEDKERQMFLSGKTKLALGRVRVVSEITLETGDFCYAMLYLGQHSVAGGVAPFASLEAYQRHAAEIQRAFEMADFPETVRQIDRHWGPAHYSLRSLFKDDQQRILQEILAEAREDLAGRFRLITERYEPLMHFLHSADVPFPPALQAASDFVFRSELRSLYEAERVDLPRLRRLLEDPRTRQERVWAGALTHAVTRQLEHWLQALAAEPENLENLHQLDRVMELTAPMPIQWNLARAQNLYWDLLHRVAPEFQRRARQGDALAQDWMPSFLALGERLHFAPQALQIQAAQEMTIQQAA